MTSALGPALSMFARDLTAKFSTLVSGQPEDQLKGPVETLLKSAADAIGLSIVCKTESTVAALGRPDFGIAINGLLGGHIELKAPGVGANTHNFTGRNKEQWQRFQSLPNLIYTDGTQWALYRTGQRVGAVLTLSGDVTTLGSSAIGTNDALALGDLFRNFFNWQPIVPTTPKELAELLAPLCRLLRYTVLGTIEIPNSAVAQLRVDWQNYLFPNASEDQFADAYAQTIVYALLLAHLEGLSNVSTAAAPSALSVSHDLLGNVLKVLADPLARQELETPIRIIERAISAVDVKKLSTVGDPWIYFYEYFLAAYDADLRRDRGVYYTPAQVVHAQVVLVSEILENKFDRPLSFAHEDVITLDPATGTGTYPLAIIEHALAQVIARFGDGAVSVFASNLAKNIYAFELLVGPYAVAHARIAQRLGAYGATTAAGGAQVYLTDTLEAPSAISSGLPLLYRPLTDELKRAQAVKRDTRVFVCIGNPPYDREQRDMDSKGVRKGGWVRHGTPGADEIALLDDFLLPARLAGAGIHLKNLYNDYVYFWRWALWKVFDQTEGPGVVCFITASSYLRGPGFGGMREVLRKTFDELWIIDLGGDGRGTRTSQNVFNIQTPVCIALGVRYGAPHSERPSTVHRATVTGSRDQKFEKLANIASLSDLSWESCLDGWQEPFTPKHYSWYLSIPALEDLLPWRTSGVQLKRTWPISEERSTLRDRWSALLNAADRRKAFRETPARMVAKSYKPLPGQPKQKALALEPVGAPPPVDEPYGFRSFDRRWLIADSRLADRIRPGLWASHSDKQVYISTLFETPLGEGPAATVTGFIPDLHNFRGSFGGADIVPLWRDAAATKPNVNSRIRKSLEIAYASSIADDDLFCYCYFVLSTPAYTKKFWDELEYYPPRIPVTKNPALFFEAAAQGRRIIWLHTFATRMQEAPSRPSKVPQGVARATKPIGTSAADYPANLSYDSLNSTLHVGRGEFSPISAYVWEYSCSGLQIVRSWIEARLKQGSGKRSSPLDDIRPKIWTAAFTTELLELLWVLEKTIEFAPDHNQLFEKIMLSECVTRYEPPLAEEILVESHLDEASVPFEDLL